jgi:hypothetical protein
MTLMRTSGTAIINHGPDLIVGKRQALLDSKMKAIDEPMDWSATEELAAARAGTNKKNVGIELRVEYVERKKAMGLEPGAICGGGK